MQVISKLGIGPLAEFQYGDKGVSSLSGTAKIVRGEGESQQEG